jgi:hypothetical protein
MSPASGFARSNTSRSKKLQHLHQAQHVRKDFEIASGCPLRTLQRHT